MYNATMYFYAYVLAAIDFGCFTYFGVYCESMHVKKLTYFMMLVQRYQTLLTCQARSCHATYAVCVCGM